MDDFFAPHDIAAEEAVNGSLLIDGKAIYEVAATLKASAFYSGPNRNIYEAGLALYERGMAIDQVTLAAEMDKQQTLEPSGGAAYLSYLIGVVPTSLDIEHYAAVVHRLSVMRALVVAGRRIAGIGSGNEDEIDEAINKAETVLFDLGGEQPGSFVHIKGLLDGMLNMEETDKDAAVLSGFRDLDALTGGMQPADLVILAGRPSMGKTSLGLNIARNVAMEQGHKVAIFSLEMSAQSLVQRLVTSESGVNVNSPAMTIVDENDERLLMRAIGLLSECNIFVDDTPVASIGELRAKARRLHQAEGLGLVVVDYLQLMQGQEDKGSNRVQEISFITRNLKRLARELGVPVLVLSQLSRAVEQRQAHRPQLSDLRESGSIEQDADIVMFITRDDYYYPTEQDWLLQYPDRDYPRGIAQVIVAKHRNGPTGDINLRFVPKLTKFETIVGPAPDLM